MKETSIIISGFGGQGVLFAGQVLAYTGMDEGMQVTWIPSYGPEMRGGTAHCTVTLCDEPIGSPLVRRPSVAVAMNRPSMDRYEPLVEDDGLLVVNSSLAGRPAARENLRVLEIPATEIAEELGDRRLANMVLMGAMLAQTRLLPLESVERTLEARLPASRREMLTPNREALRRGAVLASRQT